MSGSGVRFTETMRGFVSTSSVDDYQAGFDRGQADESPLDFTVTVTADDVDRLVDERDHEADLAGTVTAPALSPTPLTVEGGRFNLLVRDAEHAGARQMLYSMPLVADDGRRFHLEGFKQIQDDEGMDLWSDTTTLYVTVHDGEGAERSGRGQGHRHDPRSGLRQAADDDARDRRRSSRPAQGAGDVRPDVRRVAQRDLRQRLRQAERVQPGRRAARAPGPDAAARPRCTSSAPTTTSSCASPASTAGRRGR